MIFSNKPDSVIYFEECLINPPTFPGALPTSKYLDDLHYGAMGGNFNAEELSVRVGEVLGSICVKVVIASAILGFRSTVGNRSETKKLEKAMISFTRKSLADVQLSKSVGNVGMTINLKENEYSLPGLELIPEVLAQAAAENLNFLIQAMRPDTVLQYERLVRSEIINVRIEAMSSIRPSSLTAEFYGGIQELTGFRIEG